MRNWPVRSLTFIGYDDADLESKLEQSIIKAVKKQGQMQNHPNTWFEAKVKSEQNFSDCNDERIHQSD